MPLLVHEEGDPFAETAKEMLEFNIGDKSFD